MEEKLKVRKKFAGAFGLIKKGDDRVKSVTVSVQTPKTKEEGEKYRWILSLLPIKENNFLVLKHIELPQLDTQMVQSIMSDHFESILRFYQASLGDAEYFNEVLTGLFLSFENRFWCSSSLKILLLKLPERFCSSNAQIFEAIRRARNGEFSCEESLKLYLMEGMQALLGNKIDQEYARHFPGELEFLKKYKAVDIDQAFRCAVATGPMEDIKKLVELGVNIDGKGTDTKRTALHVACIKQRKEVVEYLLELGVEREVFDKYDKKPSNYGYQEILEKGMGIKI